MNHKLGVCVPYRNREAHLKEFVPKVSKFLDECGIDHTIYLGHQCDEKLFNRGLMKNIAAKFAFDDGCDYIVWHDIDMIPEDRSCDYSYNPDFPQHLAVRISQSDYHLKYEEYFGGAVLFTKEQVDATNGYSNDYWDWGMEDDDLFWRCQMEGLLNKEMLNYSTKKMVGVFDGSKSYIEVPNQNLCKLHNSHTISILVKADQQIERVPIWLIGDKNRKFVEYPIFRKPGYDWGLSFNNSRAYTAMLWGSNKEHIYQWFKRYENEWSWITMVVDTIDNKMHWYLNGRESSARNGTGTESPIVFDTNLKRYGSEPFYIGYTPSTFASEPNAFFKGQIADLKMWDTALTDSEVKNLHIDYPKNNLILHYDFQTVNRQTNQLVDLVNGNNGKLNRVIFKSEEIQIPHISLPHRRDGKFFCLPHQNEGLITEGGIDRWAKGETTARNERRYVLQMQQGKINYKQDGINSMKYEFISVDTIYERHKLINVKA